ncbi:hypothetical protein Tsubulata_034924, partial [Turnera subulata]
MAKPPILVETGLTLLILVSWCCPCFCCPTYQKEALLQFKYLLVGNNSSQVGLNGLETWNSTSDCCQWEKVTCSSSTTSPQQISGPGFANFSEIVTLRMNANSFSGSIPLEFYSLRHLEYLYLHDNMIEGELASNLGNLSNIKELELTYNAIHGEIPREIGNLVYLQKLLLGSNNFSGLVPPEIGNLRNISTLSLDGNSLSGEIPSSFEMLENLEGLGLSENFLFGEIPTWLFNSKSIKFLLLGGNNFTWE